MKKTLPHPKSLLFIGLTFQMIIEEGVKQYHSWIVVSPKETKKASDRDLWKLGVEVTKL